MIGEKMEGAWYESLRIEGLQVGEEESFRKEWDMKTVEKGRRRECPVEALEEMMKEEKWKNVRAKIVRVERENKNRSRKFYNIEEDRERINEEEQEREVIVISSSEEEEKEVMKIASSDEEIEEITLSSGEEEDQSLQRKAERCQLCRSFGCRGAETARQCQKCGYLTLKCLVAKHQRWCKTH